MIKNIIFDIGCVLVDFNPGRVLTEMGLPPEEVQIIQTNTVLGPHWKELDRGVMPKEEVFELMIKDVPVPYQSDARNFLYNHTLETVTCFDYSEAWVKGLKEKGYKVYLLTNYPQWMFEPHFKNLFTFAPYVDGYVVSAVEKLIKPDHQIYKTLINRFNLKPEESVFIDDRLENVQGAVETGLKGIQFTTKEETFKNLDALLAVK